MILMDDTNSETQENRQLENELKNTDWYMLDSFWGTREERNLIEFIRGTSKNSPLAIFSRCHPVYFIIKIFCF